MAEHGRNPERRGLRLDFLAEVEEEVRRAEVKLGKGGARDWAGYRAAVEQIAAFRRCALLFDQVYARYVDEEEDDDEV